MDIDVFFNRPDRPVNLERLLTDIRIAQYRLVVASAWFTDTQLARAILQCRAETKIVILNRADLKRGDYEAYKLLANDRYIQSQKHGSGLFVVGGSSWEQGIMHHKFCVMDYRVVWTGSYNYTVQARRNYETLLRIKSMTLGDTFFDEALELIGQGYPAGEEHDSDDMAPVDAASDDVWKFCKQCKRPVVPEQVCEWNSAGDVWCEECSMGPEEETATCERCHAVEASETCCYDHGGGPICVRCCTSLGEHLGEHEDSLPPEEDWMRP